MEENLLKAVSRTFYLSMKWLPAAMRPAISLGYMLARATDSVADTSVASSAERLAVLRRMGAAVAGTAPLPPELAGAMAEAQQNPAERCLLQRFGECLEMLVALPEAEKSLVRQVLATIVEGQCWDLTYFEGRGSVQSDEETRLYTYRVAGCVGEFWTDLGYATMGADFCEDTPECRDLMRRAGVRYGQGLQLVNILRDVQEDAARGRRYLCSDTAVWLNRAERYLQDGVDYSIRLGSFRLRFASMLPAVLGLATLRLLRRPENARRRVKISRGCVYGCMLKTALRCLKKR